mmetsp:Transcript_53434/g.94993  ORF Transcript_53434/g.94993 Transcript_53434/m.94993 type:complete len:383 (+) Transcript_53434:79-1227(+)
MRVIAALFSYSASAVLSDRMQLMKDQVQAIACGEQEQHISQRANHTTHCTSFLAALKQPHSKRRVEGSDSMKVFATFLLAYQVAAFDTFGVRPCSPPGHPRCNHNGLPCVQPRTASPISLIIIPKNSVSVAISTAVILLAIGAPGVSMSKVRDARSRRSERNAAVEKLRKAQVLQLAGKLDERVVDRLNAKALEQVQKFEDSRTILKFPWGPLQLSDPNADVVQSVLKKEGEWWKDSSLKPKLSSEEKQEQQEEEMIKALRFGELEATNTTAESSSASWFSNLTWQKVGELALKVLVVNALVQTVLLFLLVQTDPTEEPTGVLAELLRVGGDWVDRREAERAARDPEYAARVKQQQNSVDAFPDCATRKIGDPDGGCDNIKN